MTSSPVCFSVWEDSAGWHDRTGGRLVFSVAKSAPPQNYPYRADRAQKFPVLQEQEKFIFPDIFQ
jgi:hypothetical protein